MGPEQPTNNQQYTTPTSNPGQFTQAEPPKNKKTGLMIAIIAAVVILVGIVIFAMTRSNKDDSNSSNTGNSDTSANEGSNSNAIDSNKYQKYEVADTASGATFSIAFYKDAKVEEKKGRTFLNAGETGSMYSVYLGTVTGDKIDCADSPSTTMKLGGESTKVCYMADNTHYIGYVKTKSGLSELNLAGQQAINADDAKAIMESVSFN